MGEEAPKKFTYNKIKRASVSFKCDICGEMFDGDGAESLYKKHIAGCEKFDIQQIITPPTIDIPKYIGMQQLNEQGEETGVVIPHNVEHKTMDDIIAEMKNVVAGQPHVEWQINYVCPVCNIKSK